MSCWWIRVQTWKIARTFRYNEDIFSIWTAITWLGNFHGLRSRKLVSASCNPTHVYLQYQIVRKIFYILFFQNSYFEKKYLIYYSIGEAKKDFSTFSFTYKMKFVYYMLLTFICLIKFMIALTDMLSYRVFGETNLFINIIKFIGLY